jgi:Trypsin
MPKGTWMGPRWLLGSAAALVAAAVLCAPAGAIVGGSAVPLTEHPYQVALIKAGQTAVNGQFCGGSIRDSRHVITAAHCVWDNNASSTGQPVAAAQVDVLAGAEDLRSESAGQRAGVSSISVDPQYDSGELQHDAAVLTLAAPLTLGAKEQPIELVSDGASAALISGAPLAVTGWGDTTSNGDYPFDVHGVSVPFVPDPTCKYDYENNYIVPFPMAPSLQVCAGDGTHDSCYGDSGGALVIPNGASPADDRLVGIVSWGSPFHCADADFPGVYTEIAYPTIRSFVSLGSPPAAPVNQSLPALTGTASIGRQLSCSPGSWTGSPTFSYQFVRSTSAGDVGVASNGPATYTVGAADAGTSLRCVVTATNTGGTSIAQTDRLGPVPGLNTNAGTNSLDKNAPVAKVVKTKCTSSRCVLTVTVTDAGYSAGIKTVLASVTSTYRATCKKHGRNVRCTKRKTKKLSAKKLAATRFQIVASKLPVGKQVFTLVAVDKAGHQQRLPTRKTVTTKRAKKR